VHCVTCDQQQTVVLFPSRRAHWGPLADSLHTALTELGCRAILCRSRIAALITLICVRIYARYLNTFICRSCFKPVILLSDNPKDRVHALLQCVWGNGRRCHFWWNSLDEASASAAPESHAAHFFVSDDALSPPYAATNTAALRASRCQSYTYAPYAPRIRRSSPLQAKIFYAAECEIDIEACGDLAAEIVWASVLELNSAIWHQASLACKYHSANREFVDTLGLSAATHTRLQWLLLNRIRFLYVTSLADALGDRFVLWGSDWKRLGVPMALPSNFSFRSTQLMYDSCYASLDMGSKSCGAHIYPRLADIIRAGGLPLQVTLTGNSAGEGLVPSDLVFDSLNECIEKAQQLLTRSVADNCALRSEVRSRYDVVASSAMQSLGGRIKELCSTQC